MLLNSKKRFLGLILMLVLVMTSAINVFAEDLVETNLQNGVEVTISTSKEKYTKDEVVDFEIKIKNTNYYDLDNVKMDYSITDTMKEFVGDVKELPATIEKLKSNEELVLTLKAEKPGLDQNIIIMAVVAVIVIVVIAIVILLLKGKKKKLKEIASIVLVVLVSGSIFSHTAAPTQAAQVVDKSNKTTSVLKFSHDGKAAMINVTANYIVKVSDAKYSRVSVHDPSIIKVGEEYYVFGSHRAVAKTTDMMNWKNVNAYSGFAQTFGELYKEWASLDQGGKSTISIDGNMWAPDIIYNKELKKYCLYMSLNGVDWNSVIVMATSDNIEGPYTNAQTIVYSGFTNDGRHPVELTDYEKITGEKTVNDRYLKSDGKWDPDYGTNAIDASVFYDQEGKLWMIYGSWFGGLFMLELDESTGLRDLNVKYETVPNESDAYMGKKVAGGRFVSGEAPYIIFIDGYYYLFTTYGGLTSNAGYNMRLFRSENPDGPYVDAVGTSAIYTTNVNNIAGPRGVKILSNYKWAGIGQAYMAGGHNSILVDEDGKIFNYYHTRFDDGGEGHQVRVHQMFVNKDGWLVQAPNEYSGETISETGYDKAQLVGEYEILFHATNISGANYVKPIYAKLNEDGTVTGDFEGKWTVEDGKPNMTITHKDKTYTGVFVNQADSTSNRRMVMSFTALCTENNTMIWGNTK